MGRRYKRVDVRVESTRVDRNSDWAYMKMPMAPCGDHEGAVYFLGHQKIGAIESSDSILQRASSKGNIPFDSLQSSVFTCCHDIFSYKNGVLISGSMQGSVNPLIAYINPNTDIEGSETIIPNRLLPSGFVTPSPVLKLDGNVMGMLAHHVSRIYFFSVEDAIARGSADWVSRSTYLLDPTALAMARNITVLADINSLTVISGSMSSGETMPTVLRHSHADYGVKCEITSAEISELNDFIALGDEDGTVKLFDSRHLSKPLGRIPAETSVSVNKPVHHMAFNDLGNELYVTRGHDFEKWIEVIDTLTFETKEIIHAPHIPFLRESQRYLDYEAVWPPAADLYEFPDSSEVVSPSLSPTFERVRRAPIDIKNMIWKGDQLVLATKSGLLFVEKGKGARPKMTYSIFNDNDIETYYQ